MRWLLSTYPENMRKLKITELNRLTQEDFKKAKKTPLVVVLDNVRSLYNVGSVFRTADAFLIEKICLCGITACPPHAEIHKTALGAENTVEWNYYEDICKALKELKSEGYKLLAIEQTEGSILLNDFIPAQCEKYAVILGNEVKGVLQEAIDMCGNCIEIPQFGTKHSLNVSVTAGIVIWDFFRKMQQ